MTWTYFEYYSKHIQRLLLEANDELGVEYVIIIARKILSGAAREEKYRDITALIQNTFFKKRWTLWRFSSFHRHRDYKVAQKFNKIDSRLSAYSHICTCERKFEGLTIGMITLSS